MSVISRFRAIFEARGNQIADQMEDPKASLDYSLVRLEDSRLQINQSLIEVSAARRRLESQAEMLGAGIQKTQEQARQAVQGGREDLARIALARKQEAEARLEQLEGNITALERQLEGLKQSQANLDHKISIFRAKKEELKAIYDSSRAQLQMREAISGISADLADVGSSIQRAEARIREIQSRSEAIEGLVAEGVLSDGIENQDALDRELSQASRQQAIEAELARLKGTTLDGPQEELRLPPGADNGGS